MAAGAPTTSLLTDRAVDEAWGELYTQLLELLKEVGKLGKVLEEN